MPPKSLTKEIPPFLVAQLGARMHYAVPRILHAAGRLDRLYTDFAAPRLLGGLRLPAPPIGVLRRMLSRAPEGIPPERIAHFPAMACSVGLVSRLARTQAGFLRTWFRAGEVFCRAIVKRGFGEAGAVYAFSSAALPLLEAAGERGLLRVLEQPIAPLPVAARLLAEEAAAWPGWDRQSTPQALSAAMELRERAEWAAADLILCGSEFVRRGVAEAGGPVERCAVVPYGVDMPAPASGRRRRSAPLKVLFCGTAGLRKGIPYLLEAARMLEPSRHRFRIVGVPELPRGLRLPANVEVVGSLPRPAVPKYFRWADVFALPTVCEGSATVCYEALAAGLPVVTTENAGSVIRDGVDGYILPIRRADLLAERLDLLASSPALLDELSENAQERSRSFTLECYSDRLLAALADAGETVCHATTH